jgi:AAA family ATP:ADP antiporter
MVDATMKQSINKASTELMMLPVPEDIKLQTKTFLDVFIDSLATGASGVILLFVVKGLDLPNQVISLVILIGALLWFFIGNKLRVEYKSIFRQSLKIRSDKIATEETAIIDDYKDLLDSGNEFQILKVLSFLKKNNLVGIEKQILNLLNHENNKIVEATLETIMYQEKDFHEAVIPLLSNPNQNVKINAFEYLINHQQRLEPNFLITLLNDSDEETKITAVAAYAKEYQNNRSVLNVLRINDRISKMLENHDIQDETKLYKSIGLLKSIAIGKFAEYYYFIHSCLESGNEQLYGHALLAAGETRSAQFLKLLVKKLEDQPLASSIFLALAKFGSQRIEKVFDNLLYHKDLKKARNIPSILELIPEQRSIDLLQKMSIHSDYTLKNNAIASLYSLLEKFPLLKVDEQVIHKILLDEAGYNNQLLNVLLLERGKVNENYSSLIDLLKKRIDENLTTIFKLLHIHYPPDNFIEIYKYVQGSDQTLRDNSIEYLQNTLGPPLKSSIISLIEYNFLHIGDQSLKKTYSESSGDIKDFLCNNRDPDIKAAAMLYYQEQA